MKTCDARPTAQRIPVRCEALDTRANHALRAPHRAYFATYPYPRLPAAHPSQRAYTVGSPFPVNAWPCPPAWPRSRFLLPHVLLIITQVPPSPSCKSASSCTDWNLCPSARMYTVHWPLRHAFYIWLALRVGRAALRSTLATSVNRCFY